MLHGDTSYVHECFRNAFCVVSRLCVQSLASFRIHSNFLALGQTRAAVEARGEVNFNMSLCAPSGVILPETALAFPPGSEDQDAQLPKDQ